MYKKIIPFIIAIPALFLILVFKILPAIFSLIISLKEYNYARGIFGSPWIGTKNYSTFFQAAEFTNLLRNTLFLNTLSVVFTCIFAIVFIVCISKMPNKIWKLGAIIILSVPAFIPIVSFVGVFTKVFSLNIGIINDIFRLLGIEPRMFFGEPSLYPILFAVMDSMRSVYIPVIIGVLVFEKSNGIEVNKIILVIIGYVGARATGLLSPDVENIMLSYNPMVYSSADVLDTYSFRNSFMLGQIGFGDAVWVTKTIGQLLVNIAIYFILSSVLPKITEVIDPLGNKINRKLDSIISILGYVVFASGSIAIIILTFVPNSKNLAEGFKMLFSNKEFSMSIFNTFLYCILSCIVYGFITITVAYPLVVKTKIYPIILLVIASLANNFIGEYFVFRSMGMGNTIFPVVIGPSVSVIGALALHFTVSNKFKDSIPSLVQYLRTAILPLFTIIVLFFIANWGSNIYQMIYLSNGSMFGLSMFSYRTIFSQNNLNSADDIKSALILISSTIPVLLGTVLICLSKYLPLSGVGSQIRRG